MPEPRTEIRWHPASAWALISAPARGGATHGEAGVRIEPVAASHVVSIVARRTRREDLARIVVERLGIALPAQGRLTEGPGCDLVWSGPDNWLAITRETMEPDLRRDLATVAAVTDQSSARALLHVSGPDVRHMLSKGFAIDLDPTVFVPGCAAVTGVAHISVQIWRRHDGRYTIAVPRSFASGFWSWLITASSAHGYEIAA